MSRPSYRRRRRVKRRSGIIDSSVPRHGTDESICNFFSLQTENGAASYAFSVFCLACCFSPLSFVGENTSRHCNQKHPLYA